MKGSKEGKGDGGKAATGPALFPRLHVTETKKAGPRGPPRNKMALYEQLTIPSHRFKPNPVPLPSSGRATNGSMTTPVYQPQVQSPASSFDSRYSYMPVSYMSPIIPTMAYMPMMNVGMYGAGTGSGGGASATSSMNASSARSTVFDAATESQRVPRGEEAVSRRQNSSGHSRPSAGSKEGKEDDDFAVPTYSATQASSQTRAPPFQVQQALRGGRGAQKAKESAMEKRCGGGVDGVRRMRKERSMEDDASWTSASVECVTVSVVDDDVNTQVADGGRRDCDGNTEELSVSHHIGQERMKEQKEKGLSNHSNTTSSAGARPEVIDGLRPVPEQDALSGQNQSGEVSEPSQPRGGSSTETELSMMENMTSGPICFRDVVDAFGQQEFWKAQSTIIRQQKLFARQVFELHRVIEVQKLLAKKSSLSLNIDEVLVEEEADNVPIPASPVAAVPVVPEIPETDGSQSSEENSRPVPEAVCQPIYPLSVPTQQDYNSASAWQAAPFGANPWAARMPSPFMYVPYSGPCPSGYGVYPTMGGPMPMYGGAGGLQGARFPAWQQPGMSQAWGFQESVAAAAAAAGGWYGQQPVVPTVGAPVVPTVGVSVVPTVGASVVPTVGASVVPTVGASVVPSASMGGIVGGPCNSERLAPSAVNQAVQGSNASEESSGEKGDGGANRSSKADGVKNFGWAKGWGSMEERVVRGEVETSKNKESIAVAPSVAYELGRREGDMGRGEKQIQNGDAAAERNELRGSASGSGLDLESEPRTWPSGASYEGPLQNRTLKRPRADAPEVALSPWLRVMAPSNRMSQQQNGVIKVVPRAVSATPESAASILLSIQKERQR